MNSVQCVSPEIETRVLYSERSQQRYALMNLFYHSLAIRECKDDLFDYQQLSIFQSFEMLDFAYGWEIEHYLDFDFLASRVDLEKIINLFHSYRSRGISYRFLTLFPMCLMWCIFCEKPNDVRSSFNDRNRALHSFFHRHLTQIIRVFSLENCKRDGERIIDDGLYHDSAERCVCPLWQQYELALGFLTDEEKSKYIPLFLETFSELESEHSIAYSLPGRHYLLVTSRPSDPYFAYRGF